jgi:hypothetical protein
VDSRAALVQTGTTKELVVPQIDERELQVLDALDRLSPAGRREAVRRLVAGAATLDRIADTLQPRIVEVARQRDLNWNGLSDEERERLVDDILHE